MRFTIILSLLMLSVVAEANPKDQERKSLGIECREYYTFVFNQSHIANFQMNGWQHQKLTPVSYDPKLEIVKYVMESKNSPLEQLSAKSIYEITYNYKKNSFTVNGKVLDVSGKELGQFLRNVNGTSVLDKLEAEQHNVVAWYGREGKVTLVAQMNGIDFKLLGQSYTESTYDSVKSGLGQVANFGISCN